MYWWDFAYLLQNKNAEEWSLHLTACCLSSSFPVCAPLRGHPSNNEFWQLKPTAETGSSQDISDSCLRATDFKSRCFPSALPTTQAPLVSTELMLRSFCAPNAAVLSKQRLNLPSCWSGSDSIALWEIHLLPTAWPKLFSMPRKFWMSSHLFFSYCHQRGKQGIGKSWPVLQTKSPSLRKHWELTQRVPQEERNYGYIFCESPRSS